VSIELQFRSSILSFFCESSKQNCVILWQQTGKIKMQTREHRLLKANDTIAQAFIKWGLISNGDIITRNSSLLQPVIFDGMRAMLKVALHDEERRGAALMACWDGNGAAKVLKYDEDVLLLQLATGTKSLRQMVLGGNEDEANKIICGVAANLHNANCMTLAELTPLKLWFSDLGHAPAKYGGIFGECLNVADQLLNDPRDIVALHGDIHYDNILDSGRGEWVAIDPKALLGERGFDFANLFCNPTPEIALSETRLQRQAKLIALETGIDIKRLLQWILAWCGLCAAWTLDDRKDPYVQIAIAGYALKELAAF